MRLEDLPGPTCPHCGDEMPADRRVDAIYCSLECTRASYRVLEQQARLDAKRDRAPCVHCGAPIPPERNARAIHCSPQCRTAAGVARYRLRRARACGWCGKTFHAKQETQRYCCRWCAAQDRLRRHRPRPCEWCGTIIQQPRRGAKYCRIKCAARAREAGKREAGQIAPAGFHASSPRSNPVSR